MLSHILESFPEEDFLVADGFDEAIIGVETNTMRLIYSYTKCIEILTRDMDYQEATEYFNFNVSGVYIGDRTPIWCYDDFI